MSPHKHYAGCGHIPPNNCPTNPGGTSVSTNMDIYVGLLLSLALLSLAILIMIISIYKKFSKRLK